MDDRCVFPIELPLFLGGADGDEWVKVSRVLQTQCSDPIITNRGGFRCATRVSLRLRCHVLLCSAAERWDEAWAGGQGGLSRYVVSKRRGGNDKRPSNAGLSQTPSSCSTLLNSSLGAVAVRMGLRACRPARGGRHISLVLQYVNPLA